jgi:thiamine biosynthesis lipoprotein
MERMEIVAMDERSAVVETTFRAMGTTVSLVSATAAEPASRAADERVRAIFLREEQRLSRLGDDSELRRVNASAGRWVPISDDLERLVRFALTQADRTGGLFDPTMLDAMIAAGHDQDVGAVLAGERGALHPPRPCGRWSEIEVRRGSIRLPPDVGLDLGGVAKGWTADLAAAEAVRAGLAWALVDAGGDLRIAADAPPDRCAIEDPMIANEEAARLRIAAGALASSSTTRRTWGSGLHHVIDPRTGAPSSAPVLRATVWAPSCAEAEVLATWALLTGPRALDRLQCAIATPDGDLMVSFEVAA